MPTWPQYERETDEDLDVHLENYDTPVPADQIEVQVVPYQSRPMPNGWTAAPYRLVAASLGLGKWDLYTRWLNPTGRKPVDHVGERGMPSFETV